MRVSAMSNTGTKDTWSEFGYARPDSGAEYRVAEIAGNYKKQTTPGLKALRKELKQLAEEGKLRIGYQDWAQRLRLRIKEVFPTG